MAGVDLTGFTPEVIEDIKAALEADLQAAFGASIDVRPQSVFGQIIGIMAERYADLWSASQSVYTSFTPDGATGASLDSLCALTGTIRLDAASSTVTLYLSGTNGTVIASGKQASVASIGTKFQTTASATLATATAWAGSTAYAVGDVRRNGATQRIYYCTVAGTSASSGGPTVTVGNTVTDGTVTWVCIGDGAAYASVAAESVDTGPKVGAAYTISVIETPVSGWQGALNVLDATLGRDVETDAALRLRRVTELRATSNTSVPAIRARLLGVDGVTQCTVFENVSDATDANGLPPHSVECLVTGGTTADVTEKIFNCVAAGIATYGTSSATVTDSLGNSYTIYYSRPTNLPIYVEFNVSVDASKWPADGVTQIQQLVADYGDTLTTGRDVVSSSLTAQSFKVPGVLDSVAYISTSPFPTSTATIVVNNRQLAVYDTSRINVNVFFGVP